jgi:predicted ATPase/DNA-binding NarL/FixJ family response regulator
MNNIDPHMLFSTPFLGREREITELTKMLQKPACRLVTLTGPGGIGKTRLAVEIARKLSHHYYDGVYLVELQPVGSVDSLVSTIVDIVAPQLRGQSEIQTALFQNVKNKQMLIVLDNFEHLMPGVELVSALLANTTQLDVLVTSRHTLNLREEWLYAIEGLAVPSDHTNGMQAYSAVQLFMTYAQRIQYSFDLEQEAEHVVRICQLVGGMPLAIEIAASWLTVLPCAVIPEEIQRSLDFLTTSLHDVPERHRSIQAVFSHTWELLSDAERQVLAALSVFQRDFELQAAEYIAGASLAIIAGLVQKSLLNRQENGRYRLHQLVRQYAGSQLEQNPGEACQVQERHCTYYTAFLNQRTESITGPQQVTVLREIADEIEDIRAVWRYIVEQERMEDINHALYTLIEFLDLQGRYSEALRVMDQAAASLRQTPPSIERDRLMAMTIAMLGYDHVRIGQHSEARQAFEQSTTLLRELGEQPRAGFGVDPRIGLGLLELIAGNYPAAIEYADQARQRCETQNNLLDGQVAHYALANAYAAQGDYDHAHECASRAYALTEQTGNRWMMAYVLLLMGDIERHLNNLAQARHYYQAGAEIKREMNDPEGVALALQRLGRVAYMEEDYAAASESYRQSLSLYQEINDPGGLATTLHGLGDTAWAQGDVSLAVHHYHESLQIALEIQWMPLILSILASAPRILNTKQPERAIEILTFVQQHAAAEHEAQALASRQLADLKRKVHSATFAETVRRSSAENELAIAREVLGELSLLKTNPFLVEDVIPPHSGPTADEALLDPLTERELEVLALMAQGLTNRQIAEQLVVVIGTVKAHSHSIYSKLGVNNRVQAINRAEELHLI